MAGAWLLPDWGRGLRVTEGRQSAAGVPAPEVSC